VKQFILTEQPDKDNTVRLEGRDYHYLVRVRRLATGEFFPAILPNGKETLVKIMSINQKVLTGKCQSLEDSPDETVLDNAASVKAASSEKKLPSIILFQSLPKGDKMDLIVRQAAEGGITEIVPFISEFSVAKTGADGQKYARWERIIREARQQSGSKIATAIHRPAAGKSLTIGGLFEYWAKLKEAGALGLFFHHMGLEKESLHGYLDSIGSVVAMAIGPEGGFSDAEAALFLEKGFKPVTIGDTVLRTETAALYCAAAVKILLLERDSWALKQVKKSCGLTC
jgi:16S rRNA (uracil1498-N3)-methyltransferase